MNILEPIKHVIGKFWRTLIEVRSNTWGQPSSFMEFRQFVYLDDLAVRSLLASMDIAVPEEVQETDESVQELEGEGEIGGGAEIPFIGSANLGAEVAGSKTGREMIQTRKKISDQYVFNIFHSKLEDQISIVSESGMGTEEGELVKLEGEIQTDAIYRLLKAISLFNDVIESEDFEKMQRAEELLYEKGIGISIDCDDTRFSCASTLTPENMWIDQERAFLGDKQYTIVGRVYSTFEGDESWDYLDIVKIIDTIVADETMDDLRTMATQFIEMLGETSEEYERPDIGSAEIESLSGLEKLNEVPDSVKSTFSLAVDEREIAIEGPGVVIDPIAIYW